MNALFCASGYNIIINTEFTPQATGMTDIHIKALRTHVMLSSANRNKALGSVSSRYYALGIAAGGHASSSTVMSCMLIVSYISLIHPAPEAVYFDLANKASQTSILLSRRNTSSLQNKAFR